MYERFFYLKEKPFHVTPDPRFLYLGRRHGEAMGLLSYGIMERKGFMLLTGEVGTGKTTLCRALLEKLPSSTESALILNPMLSGRELLTTIVHDFGLKPSSETVRSQIDTLNAFLLERYSKAANAVVIIDEAQDLSEEALEMVRLLSNLETEKEKLLQIALVGQSELCRKLKSERLRQLDQRIIIRSRLTPLDKKETSAYIENRLNVAGGTGSVKFTSNALMAIHKASGGIPRLINMVCDRALAAAFIFERRLIDGKIIAAALRELKNDGYITSRGVDACVEYTPHIAASMFLLALLAGIFFGPGH